MDKTTKTDRMTWKDFNYGVTDLSMSALISEAKYLKEQVFLIINQGNIFDKTLEDMNLFIIKQLLNEVKELQSILKSPMNDKRIVNEVRKTIIKYVGNLNKTVIRFSPYLKDNIK